MRIQRVVTNDLSTAGLSDFEAPAGIRTRLVPPEDVKDLRVTCEDVEVAMRAFRRYRETWQAAFG